MIVSNPPPTPTAPSPFDVSERPVLQIGLVEGDPEYQFQDIAAATRLSDGTIVVADRGAGEVRFFDGTGRFLRKVGRPGRGPGEFRRLSRVAALAGDSLLAWDASGSRFTIFTPMGAVERTFRPQAFPGVPPGYLGFVPGLLDGGFFFAYRIGRVPPPAEKAIVRDTLIVALYARDGSYVREVGRFLGLETLQDAGGSMPGPDGTMRPAFSIAGVPFARETHFAVGAEWLYVGDGGAAYEILGYDRTGTLKRIVRVIREPQRVTGSVIARHRAEPRDLGTPSRPSPSPNLDAKFYPETIPAYALLRVDRAQRLWVQDYPEPGETQARWTVFDRDGKLIGSVRMPQDVRILEIGTSYLLGVWHDEFDVEYLRMYGLSPAG